MHERKLRKLRETVNSQNITELSKDVELFEGADIIITDDPMRDDMRGFSVCTKVLTPLARELSWLIFQLKDIFSGELDYMNKFYFYPELAKAAKVYVEAGNNDLNGLLNTVLDTADTIRL
jgi:hypothetical protein